MIVELMNSFLWKQLSDNEENLWLRTVVRRYYFSFIWRMNVSHAVNDMTRWKRRIKREILGKLPLMEITWDSDPSTAKCQWKEESGRETNENNSVLKRFFLSFRFVWCWRYRDWLVNSIVLMVLQWRYITFLMCCSLCWNWTAVSRQTMSPSMSMTNTEE
jgi:hypothetical protein